MLHSTHLELYENGVFTSLLHTDTNGLNELAKGRTTIVVAHRLSTIKNADKIVVLTQNGIEQVGTHSELLESGGIYSELYSAYSAD